VYGGLPRGRRRRLHAQAAEVLAKRAGAPTIHLAAQIARQYNLGGMLAEARRWAITACDSFRDSTLMPRMQQGIEGGFAAPPEETGFEIATEIDA
jgi:hypothetical protein